MSTPTTLQGIPLAGLRLGAPLGSGAGGVVWAATTTQGEKVAVRVLPEVEPSRRAVRSNRLELLRSLTHPGLSGPVMIAEEVDERLLVTRLVDGPTLATVRAGRMGLSAPEALTLAAEVGEALAALHAQGLTHGDIAPGNVMFAETDDGASHAVLVDLAAEPGWELGTAGFVAPEVSDGHVARPPSDVWALATLCVWSARPGERDEVARALHGALLSDPGARPDAASLASAMRRHPACPVRMPPPSVLAGAAVRERAQRSETVVRPTRRSRRPRHRQRSVLSRLVALGVAGALLLAGAIGWVLDRTGEDEPGPAASPSAAQVAALVSDRDAALMRLDAEALGAVSVPGSPASAEDAALLETLLAQGTTLDGLHTAVSGTQVLASSATAATVQTTLSQGVYQRTAEGTSEQVDAQRSRCVVLRLTLHEHAWRVMSVSRCTV